MNTKQEAKLKMYRATEKHCDDNSSIVSSVPAFQTALTKFKEKISDIFSTTQKKEVALTGITADKNSAKQTLCQLAADVAGMISAFAAMNNNQVLKAEVNFSITKLSKSREDQLTIYCQTIHDKGLANLASIRDYGVTQDVLTDLQNAINEFSEDTPKTRTATSQRKTLGSNLEQLFKEADYILKEQMDKLVVAFRASHPNFVATYQTTRIIIDPSKTTTQLRGKITDQTTNLPVKNALVEVIEAQITVKSNSKGDYLVKPLPSGTYTLRISATNYPTKEIDEVVAKLGEINILNVKI